MLNIQFIEYFVVYFTIIINCKNNENIQSCLLYLISFFPLLCVNYCKSTNIYINEYLRQQLFPSILLIPFSFSIVKQYMHIFGCILFYGCITILICNMYIKSKKYQLMAYFVSILYQYIFLSINYYYSFIFIIIFYLIYYFMIKSNLNFPLNEIYTISFLLSSYITYVLYQFNTISLSSSHLEIQLSHFIFIFSLFLFVIIYFLKEQKSIYIYLFISFSILIFIIILSFFYNKANVLIYIISEAIVKDDHIYILCYWFCLLFLILYIHPTTDSMKIENIIVRKFYHLLSVVLFVPIILKDIQFMNLSFSICLSLFLLIELLRYENIYPFILINNYIGSYIDDRDKNRLVITPIYLLFGNSLPIFLSIYLSIDDENNYKKIMEYGGILTLGIEDTFVYIYYYIFYIIIGCNLWSIIWKTQDIKYKENL